MVKWYRVAVVFIIIMLTSAAIVLAIHGIQNMHEFSLLHNIVAALMWIVLAGLCYFQAKLTIELYWHAQ